MVERNKRSSLDVNTPRLTIESKRVREAREKEDDKKKQTSLLLLGNERWDVLERILERIEMSVGDIGDLPSKFEEFMTVLIDPDHIYIYIQLSLLC